MSGVESNELAEEQAALRRVATLVARGAPQEQVFAAVTEEIARLFSTDFTSLSRYEPDGSEFTVLSTTENHTPVGSRWPLGGHNLSTRVFETAAPARIDDYAEATGANVERVRADGIRTAVGTPIVIDDNLWGMIAVATTGPVPLPADTEARLGSFTELVATAIANAESRAALARMADEQAALRRVATLVARGVPPEQLFAAVAEEAGRTLAVDLALVSRFDPDRTFTVLASWGRGAEEVFTGSRWPLVDGNLATVVYETGRPVRLGDLAVLAGPIAEYVRRSGSRSALATPIIVEGRAWGTISAISNQPQPLPPDSEARLASFAELVAIAVANSDVRTEVERLLDQQAALRRVATLVAEGAAPTDVFATVTREVGTLCGADLARMERYEFGDSVIGVAGWTREAGAQLAVGTRFVLEGVSIAAQVHASGRPVRVHSFADAYGPIAREARDLGIQSSVGCPIVVDGSLWGVIAASSKSAVPFPPDTEEQIGEFTELVATAIANAEARTEVAASRARIVAATDAERRRVVRDLHDGAQQRLVHTTITLTLAQRALATGEDDAHALVAEALANAQQATSELRELAHGILPRSLTRGGLLAGVGALVSRMPIPVSIDVSVGRLPPAVEATAYFVVAEALTNVAKHARAQSAEVSARIADDSLAIQVRDDGVGGARNDGGGSGLIGLADRLAAVDGRLRVESSVEGGTLVAAEIPVPA